MIKIITAFFIKKELKRKKRYELTICFCTINLLFIKISEINLRKNHLKTNFGKTLIWILGNAFFGSSPLLFVEFLRMIAPVAVASDEISHLLRDGLILFLACSMMGSVVIDILNDGIDLKGISYFALTISPFAVLGLLFVKYALIIFKIIDSNAFNGYDKLNTFIILFSLDYCTIAKYYLYKNGGINNE